MSRHHEASNHTSKNKSLRAYYSKLLPLPCLECGHPVMPGQSWDLCHRVPARLGGQTTLENTGPGHTTCNRKNGGKAGRRQQINETRQRKGLREW